MKKKISLTLLIIVILLIGSPYLIRKYWSWSERNQIVRGAELAVKNGCVSCHIPFSGKEIKNPGSRLGNVPSFFGGNLMMYIKKQDEIEDYIKYGYLKGKKPKESQLIKMPAYGDKLSEEEIEDLEAYIIAADGYNLPKDEKISKGYEIAIEYGCFSCHGVGGSGGIKNPGSFKGYIPGWLGKDFLELVKNDEELDSWIRKGTIKRFEENKIARFFLKRQKISMPAYGKVLSESEIENLKAYIKWVRSK